MDDPDIELYDNVDEIIGQMTNDIKIGQLHQSGSYEELEKQLLRCGEIGSLLNFCGADAVSGIQNTIIESISKIPLLIGDDVIHGYSTGFPIPLAESCSFDLELIEGSAAIAGREASSQGVNLIFAPMVDIARDPRWGRVAEGAGEDPYYGALVAGARVRGFQRKNSRGYPQTASCPKHFVGYGASEGGRDYDYTEISDLTLRNTYLPPFIAAIEAGALAMMSSFNDVSGSPASLCSDLLNDVLRTELGFDGMVVSDWESVQQGKAHGVAADDSDAALLGIKAGVDMDMHSGIYRQHIQALIDSGKLTRKDLDRSVKRILQTKMRLGLFDGVEWNAPQPSVYYSEDSGSVLRAPHHIAAAREIAVRSIVLLKNEGGLLPLPKSIRSLAVIGSLAVSRQDPLGCWQCKTDSSNVVTILEGISQKTGTAVQIVYAKGCDAAECNEEDMAEAVRAAGQCEAAVVVLGETCYMSGENNSRAFLDLPVSQRELLRRILEVNRRTVLVLMNGRPLTLAWEDRHVDAIVEGWQLGDESGNAIADILFGDRNPSGKLTISFPRSVGQIPVYYNHRNSGRPELIRYIDEETSPLYPFGYGLSYSSFQYSDLELSSVVMGRDDTITVSVIVANTSDVAGEETVQLYIGDLVSSVTRPVRELKAFAKKLILPGEQVRIVFNITESMLRFYRHDKKLASEPGMFRIYVGTDSRAALCKEFELV
ncbi:MAG: glycoside hydrolase family 3 N-terminal domain-containing protein [Saccharofermentanales bacterium]